MARGAIRGRIAGLIEVGAGLHPDLSGRQNVFLNGAILGMSENEIQRKFDSIVEFSEVGKFLDTEVRHYSSGMFMRLAFATAVHLLVDLREGSYQITSAGHPPALHWDLQAQEWVIDNARGTALGVLPAPELHVSEGKMFPGEALMFYTDGVVEARGSHIEAGIAWLQGAARDAISSGFAGAAGRIVAQVASGDDDRAVLILSRTAEVSLTDDHRS